MDLPKYIILRLNKTQRMREKKRRRKSPPLLSYGYVDRNEVIGWWTFRVPNGKIRK
jgi:hypothetical protein